MVTPFDEKGNVDYPAVRSMVRWYRDHGCDGIFASCLSSEIFQLNKDERVRLVREVVAESHRLAEEEPDIPPLTIVASGHISVNFEDQVEELTRVAAEGPDALILISNRLDLERKGDDQWIADAERLLECIPKDIPLGIYECPVPTIRPLSEKILRWCAGNKRFRFIKDCCCNADEIKRRLSYCAGSNLKLFNANTPTLSQSIKDGAVGYCGIMANFHPDLYALLMEYDLDSDKAKAIQKFLTWADETKQAYPCSAKYYLQQYEKIPITLHCRVMNASELDANAMKIVEQIVEKKKDLYASLGIESVSL